MLLHLSFFLNVSSVECGFVEEVLEWEFGEKPPNPIMED